MRCKALQSPAWVCSADPGTESAGMPGWVLAGEAEEIPAEFLCACGANLIRHGRCGVRDTFPFCEGKA